MFRSIEFARGTPARAALLASGILLLSCQAQSTSTLGALPAAADLAPTQAAAPAAIPVKKPYAGPTLLLAQARFSRQTDAAGQSKPVPEPATLLLLQPQGSTWHTELLVDPDSRVFHKAACIDVDGQRGILTIGATGALVKLWHHDGRGAWQAETLWQGKFGGQWDRLRDFEVGDVTGDGIADIVVATHDQGVIAVLTHLAAPPAVGGAWTVASGPDAAGKSWYVTEVYRQPNTFIHEIEMGDVDGDGQREFFATPSTPNKTDAAQSGEILVFRRDPKKGFVHDIVARFKGAHVKEILVADIGGSGRQRLYAAIEPARTSNDHAAVEVREYQRERGQWRGKSIAKVEGALQARFLLAADLTGSGHREIIMTTMKAGIWRLLPPAQADAPWTQLPIDADSSGFEHAAGIADMDGDGRPELYVSADDQDEVRQYKWDGARWARTTIYNMAPSDITWSIEECSPLP